MVALVEENVLEHLDKGRCVELAIDESKSCDFLAVVAHCFEERKEVLRCAVAFLEAQLWLEEVAFVKHLVERFISTREVAINKNNVLKERVDKKNRLAGAKDRANLDPLKRQSEEILLKRERKHQWPKKIQ